MRLKIKDAQALCCIYLQIIFTNVSIEANSLNPDHTARLQFEQSDLSLHSQT